MSKVTMVASGKGGVGKSTVCAMLGTALAQGGHTVLIVELDAGLRCLDIMLGVENRAVFDLSDVVCGRCTVRDAVLCCDNRENLFVCVAPNDPTFDFGSFGFSDFLKKLYGAFDFVLIDSPAGIGKQMEHAAAFCDSALIVVTPDPVCVRDANKAAEKLRGLGVENLRLIINRVNCAVPSANPITDFDSVIDDVSVQLIGVVPEDRSASSSLLQGGAVDSGSSFKKAFDNISKRFLGNESSLLII